MPGELLASDRLLIVAKHRRCRERCSDGQLEIGLGPVTGAFDCLFEQCLDTRLAASPCVLPLMIGPSPSGIFTPTAGLRSMTGTLVITLFFQREQGFEQQD